MRYSNSAIKREQSQIYLNYAEREQNRRQAMRILKASVT